MPTATPPFDQLSRTCFQFIKTDLRLRPPHALPHPFGYPFISAFPLSRRNIMRLCILTTFTIAIHQLHYLFLAVKQSRFFLVQNIPKEIRHHRFIPRHLSIPGKVVNINNKVPIPNLGVPNNIKVKQMQLHSLSQPARNINNQTHRRHCRVLQIQHLIIPIIIPLIRSQIRHLRKRQRTTQTI
ncbi:hypothetical protein Hanom_Chr03g00261341 [Helianthus anomalus]